jgi:DNA-binding NtrC family response regulator
MLQQIFLSAGYDCLPASNGHEGAAIFRVSRPPLTVTDLRMPGLDGIALLSAIRELDADAAVVVLTGAPDVKTAIDSLRLGADDFIMKPVNVDELLIAAERALERRQLLVAARAPRGGGHPQPPIGLSAAPGDLPGDAGNAGGGAGLP